MNPVERAATLYRISNLFDVILILDDTNRQLVGDDLLPYQVVFHEKSFLKELLDPQWVNATDDMNNTVTQVWLDADGKWRTLLIPNLVTFTDDLMEVTTNPTENTYCFFKWSGKPGICMTNFGVKFHVSRALFEQNQVIKG